MNVSLVLAALIAVVFVAAGAAKILAVPPMLAAAGHAGFSVTVASATYQRPSVSLISSIFLTRPISRPSSWSTTSGTSTSAGLNLSDPRA